MIKYNKNASKKQGKAVFEIFPRYCSRLQYAPIIWYKDEKIIVHADESESIKHVYKTIKFLTNQKLIINNIINNIM